MVFLAVAMMCAFGSYLMFRTELHLNRMVESGHLTIRMGEDITGPSYQMAIAKVFGYVFALAAIIFTAIWLGHIGTPLHS